MNRDASDTRPVAEAPENASEGEEGMSAHIEDIPGMAEACRRFDLPTLDRAAHALRELSWGEHFIASRMVPSKGGSDLYLYNLHSAAVFLLDQDQANIGKGTDQIIKLIDVDGFIDWIRAVIGDETLADALERECPPEDPYRDRLESVQRLLALRMVQYSALEGGACGADAQSEQSEEA